MKDKKTKVINVLYLYFMYKNNLLKVDNHPISGIDKLFQVSEGLGASKCLYNVAKYAKYHADELRMHFYLTMMMTLTRRRDFIFNIFRSSKPIYVAMVSKLK